PEGARERTYFEVPGHDETLFATFTDPELTVTAVSIHTKLPRRPQGTVGDYRRGLVETLYHGMINDRLYEIGHRPDPPFLYAFSGTESLVRTADVDQQEAGVPEGGVLRGLEALLTEIERVRRHGFTAGELERTKKSLLRAYERTWVQRTNRSSGSYAAEYSRNFLEDEAIPGLRVELELVRRFLPEITLDEVNSLAGLRTAEANRVILLTAPEAEAGRLPSENELLAVFERVRERPVEPYLDRTPDAPLLAAPPEPGEVVERRSIEAVGVTEWRLSNGVRVVLEPTDFREDQILLEGYSPGGHSLVPEADHLTASYAAEVVSLGGLGEHDELTLSKMMAGRVVEIGPSIDELEEGIQGAASAEDAEVLFQLVHLALTAPRLDREAIRSYKDRLGPLLENRLADPEQAFIEEMYRQLTGDHPRRRPLTPERLEAIDPDRAFEIYRERFGDASDFTFVVVGSFELEEMEELVTTYLGSLPAAGREETWRDVGIERPEGPVEVTVRRGLEPKGRVLISLNRYLDQQGDGLGAGRETRRSLRALAEALEIRLREVLREDLGAVYGVSVAPDVDWRPRERASLTIEFGCAPDRAAELVDTVRGEIERFRRGRIDPELATKVREILARQRRSDLRSNDFWLAALAAAYRRGEDPGEILGFERWTEALDTERLAASARRFLDWRSRIVGILQPEGGPE
ncbi:MAG: insulinase family protein, partial [Acidobacteriota bacterium]